MHVLGGDQELSGKPRNSDPTAAELQAPVPTPPEGGWSAWYLTDEDDVGESTEQGITVRLLLAALAELARERGWARSLVAGDQFFAWVESEPLVRISPDVYVLDDPPAPPYPGMWRTWLPGQLPPRFAVEVVSDDWAKDYDHAPRKYDQLGARELVVFDPDAVHAPRGRRVALQVFRRGERGAWTRVAAGAGPVHSAELDAWLVVVPGPRLRIARDPAGVHLVATAEEQLDLLRRETRDIRRDNAEFRREIAQLRRDNADLRRENAELHSVCAELRSENAQLRSENAELRRENAELRRENAELRSENAELRRDNAELRRDNAELRAHVETQDRIIRDQAAQLAAQAATIQEQAATIVSLEAKVAALEATVARLLERLG
jgi:Uma2 family endonuclease/cell division protein FtsB